MINISNCPITGLKRKITGFDFVWSDPNRYVKIRCMVSHYAQLDELVDNVRIKSYVKDLVASDSLVNPSNGNILTEEELADIPNLGYTPVEEYDYYKQMAYVPLVLNTQILGIIALRDSQGKFDNI